MYWQLFCGTQSQQHEVFNWLTVRWLTRRDKHTSNDTWSSDEIRTRYYVQVHRRLSVCLRYSWPVSPTTACTHNICFMYILIIYNLLFVFVSPVLLYLLLLDHLQVLNLDMKLWCGWLSVCVHANTGRIYRLHLNRLTRQWASFHKFVDHRLRRPVGLVS